MIKHLVKNGRKIFSRQETNIFSAAFAIATAMLGSALLGIWRDRLLYAQFFAKNPGQLDVYNAAFKLPDTLFQLLITGSLSAAFIPVFSKWLDRDQKKANKIASIVLNWLILLFICLAVVIFFLAPKLSQLITTSFSVQQIQLMTNLTRLLLLAQLFLLTSNFLTGIIHSHQRFILPALSPILYNLGIIGGIIFLAPHWGIYGPTAGVVIGSLLHLIIQLPLTKHLQFNFRAGYLSLSDPAIKKIVRLMIPRNLGLIVSEIEAFIIIYWATAIGEGILSLFYLAQHLTQLPIRMLGATIGQASLPALSHEHFKNGLESFQALLKKTLSQTTYLILPLTGIFLILRVPVVRLAFGTARFPWEATVLTSQTLALLSLTIFSQTYSEILRRAFYALGNTKTVFFIDSFAAVVNLGFISLATTQTDWGILGLAAGISLANFIRFLLLFQRLQKALENLITSTLIARWGKMALAALTATSLTWISLRLLDRYIFNTAYVIPLIGLTISCGLVGVGVFILVSYWFKIPELFQFTDLAKNIFRGKKK